MRRVLCTLCIFVLLTGCAGTGASSAGSGSDAAASRSIGSGAVGSETERPSPEASLAWCSSAGSIPQTALSEEGLWELYANQGLIVREVMPYQSDFLVQYQMRSDLPVRFDWVYGTSGIRQPLLVSMEGVKQCEILQQASIRVVTDGVNHETAYRSFPQIETASLAGIFDKNGTRLPGVELNPNCGGSETYWSDIGEANLFGMAGRHEAVCDARVEPSGLEMVFAPMADQSIPENNFEADFTTVPGTELSYDAGSNVLAVTCRDTYLDGGTLSPQAADSGRNTDWLKENGSLYPDAFPAGELAGSSRLIEKATICQEGDDVVVALLLTDAVTEYTVETGHMGSDDVGPYFRIVLRAAEQD